MRAYPILLSAFALSITSIRAQAIDTANVPATCQSACAPVVGASNACEEVQSDDHAGDWVCVCVAQGMTTAVPECLACVQSAPASGDDGNGNADVIAGLSSCGFSAAPAGSSAVSAGTSIQSIATLAADSAQTAAQATPTAGVSTTDGAASTLLVVTAVPSSTTDASGNLVVATGPPTTAGPTQAAEAAPSDDLEGSMLTVITATLGSGADAVVAELTSVMPGPMATQGAVEQQQLGNGGLRWDAPAAAAALGFVVAFL